MILEQEFAQQAKTIAAGYYSAGFLSFMIIGFRIVSQEANNRFQSKFLTFSIILAGALILAWVSSLIFTYPGVWHFICHWLAGISGGVLALAVCFRAIIAAAEESIYEIEFYE
jgi:hypothetical protein